MTWPARGARFLDDLARGAWPLVAIAPALCLTPTLSDAFRTGPEALAVCLAWAMAALALAARSLDGKGVAWPRPGALGLAVALAVAWVFVSAAFGVQPASAWRYGATVAAYALLGVTAAHEPQRRVLWAGLAGLWAIELAVGLLQAAHALPLPGREDGPWGLWRMLATPVEGGAPFGTLGHPNFFAEWLVLVVPPVAAHALARAGRRGRWTSGIGAIASLGLVIATGSRAAVLGLAVAWPMAALAVFGAPWRWGLAERLRRRPLVAAVAGLAALAVVGLAGGRLAAKLDAHAAPLSQAARQSADARRIHWEVAWALGREHPLTGVGLGGFKLLDPARVEARYPQGAPPAATRERFFQAHSEPLQGFAELGLVGMLAVLAGLALWVKGLLAHAALGPAERFGLLAGVGGLLVAGCFGFPFHIPVTALALVLLLAVGTPAQAPRPGSAPLTVALLALVVAGGAFALSRDLMPFVQAHHLSAQADRAYDAGRYTEAAALYAQAARGDRFDGFYRTHWAAALAMAPGRAGEALQLLDGPMGVGMDALFWRGYALESLHQPLAARAAYAQALAFYGPDHPIGRLARSRREALAR